MRAHAPPDICRDQRALPRAARVLEFRRSRDAAFLMPVSDIRFTKAQGMGNDFLIIEVEDVATLRSASELARKMCQRIYGAGADGIVFVTRARHEDADFGSRIFNADGSEAGVSGNGTRCTAAYLYHT